MSIPQATDNAKRVKQSVDRKRVAMLWKMSRYALSGVWDPQIGSNMLQAGGDWPFFEDADPDYIESGRSNKILNANRKAKSRLLTGDIEPDTQGGRVSQFTSAARKAFWKARYDGKGNDEGSWRPHMYGFFDDYDLLGVGALSVSLVKNPESGKYAVTVRHIPSQHVVWDRFARNPQNARYVAFRDFLPFETAAMWYGKDQARRALTHFQANSFTDSLPVVPRIQYYDLGIADKEPSWTTWLGDVSTPAVKHTRNPYWRMLPLAFMVNNLLPGARYPHGGVFTMMRVQEVFHEIEKGMLNRMRSGPVTVWNDKLVNEADIAKYITNDPNNGNLRMEKGASADQIAAALRREAGASLTNADIEMIRYWGEEFDKSANMSQLDQNAVLSSQRTLGEIDEMQSQSAANRAFDDQNVKNGLVEAVKAVFSVARYGDDDPVEVNVVLPDGKVRSLTVNADKDSSCEAMFEQPGEVTLDVSALTATDQRTKQLQRVRSLAQLIPLAERGAVSWERLAQETLMAIGEEDLEGWKPAPMPATQMVAGGMAPDPNAVAALPA